MVLFRVTPKRFGSYGRQVHWRVDPGDVEVIVGPDAAREQRVLRAGVSLARAAVRCLDDRSVFIPCVGSRSRADDHGVGASFSDAGLDSCASTSIRLALRPVFATREGSRRR